MEIICSKCKGQGKIDFKETMKKFGAQQVLYDDMDDKQIRRMKYHMVAQAVASVVEKYDLDNFNFTVSFSEETRSYSFGEERLLIMRGLLDAEQSIAVERNPPLC